MSDNIPIQVQLDRLKLELDKAVKEINALSELEQKIEKKIAEFSKLLEDDLK